VISLTNMVLLVFTTLPRHTMLRILVGATVSAMGDPGPFPPKNDRRFPPPAKSAASPEQQRMMVIALTLLLIALGFVLYRDRDFWFPDTQNAEDEPLENVPAAPTTGAKSEPAESAPAASGKKAQRSRHPRIQSAPGPALESAVAEPPIPPTTITRTTLPPLEVEVVAGSVLETVHPGSNSVRVELESPLPSPAQKEVESAPEAPETASSVTYAAADRAEMPSQTSEFVTHSVQPGYPMLARQMKVQGSVILQALIGRDGLIQDLRVVSGPPILATAAREAVRQWHFKPHYEGSDAVETQAKITVNFTISTN
jgi:TonB family protein